MTDTPDSPASDEAYKTRLKELCDVVRHRNLDGQGERSLLDHVKELVALEAIRAETRPAPAAVRVKPLEWRDSYGVLRAETPFGDYIATGKILKVAAVSMAFEQVCDDPKVAAQADYERRILAALSPAPVEGLTDQLADALRTARTYHEDEAGPFLPDDMEQIDAALAAYEERGDG